MKKYGYLSALFSSIVLVIVLAVGSAGADPLSQEGEVEPEPKGEVEPEPKTDADFDNLAKPGEGEAGQAASAAGTATRINFEQSPDAAREGWYVVQEKGGRMLASWYALVGWRDSGWINNINISHEAVHVRVLYYPYNGAEPTVMRILNPAGGTEYGWLARGMEHALEVAFPNSVVVYGTGGPVVATVPTVQTTQVAATTAPVQPAVSAGEQLYVVQPGNNLYRIGLQYGCSYLDIAAYNGIANPDLIYAGQTIRIPANCGV